MNEWIKIIALKNYTIATNNSFKYHFHLGSTSSKMYNNLCFYISNWQVEDFIARQPQIDTGSEK